MKLIYKREKEMEKRNLLHIEFIRIFAAYFVIFNHTGENGFFLFANCEKGSLAYWGYMLITVFCKVSVPLFLMIAGALLLKKDICLKKLWIEKILRIVLVLFVFSLIMYFVLGQQNLDFKLTVVDFLKRLYMGEICVPYWYLYVYIAFLVSVPFLRAIVTVLSEDKYKYLIIMGIILIGIIPCIEYRIFQGKVFLNSNIKPGWLLTNIVFWPLVGYYVEHIYRFKNNVKKQIGFWFLMSCIGIGVSCYMTYYMHNVTGECSEANSQAFLGSFIMLPCITIYIGMKYIFQRYYVGEYIRKIISSIGSCTFGIYLLHIIIKNFAGGFLNILLVKCRLNSMVAVLLFCLIIFFVSYVVTLILKKLPGMKKLL